jgi:hypothetical protein
VEYPETSRTRIGGQLESQRLGIDQLIDKIFDCVRVGDTPDELMGIDLPPLQFDKIQARQLIQDFLDNRSVGKSG